MVIKGNNIAARPAVAEENDVYIDLSTGIKYIYRFGEWVAPTAEPKVTLPVASPTKAGIMQVGTGLGVTAAGAVSVTFPVASATQAGVMQVGAGLDVTEAGVVSVHTEPEPSAE